MDNLHSLARVRNVLLVLQAMLKNPYLQLETYVRSVPTVNVKCT